MNAKRKKKQESRAIARRPRDADVFVLKFKSSQASKAKLQSSKRTGAKQNLTQNGHSWLSCKSSFTGTLISKFSIK